MTYTAVHPAQPLLATHAPTLLCRHAFLCRPRLDHLVHRCTEHQGVHQAMSIARVHLELLRTVCCKAAVRLLDELYHGFAVVCAYSRVYRTQGVYVYVYVPMMSMP